MSKNHSCCLEVRNAAYSTQEIAATTTTVTLTNDTFQLEGLDCADCAAKLEKAIHKLQGVTDAQVNFATAKMKVTYDQTVLEISEIRKVIDGLGYSSTLATSAKDVPEYHKSVYHLSGLDCADCGSKLEKKLISLSGVRTAAVNFGAGKVTIEHALNDDEIIQAIEQAGYQAILDSQTGPISTSKTTWWGKPKTLVTIISGILLIVGTTLDWTGQNATAVILFYALTMIVGGFHVARSGLFSLRSLTLDTNFLMLLAAIGAVAIGEWSEGATVVFLFSLGNALQAYTMDKTRESIRALMELAPPEALVRRNGQESKMSIEAVIIGDIIIVKPGERIAMDGDIINGLSTVNQAAITGESMPVEKHVGDMAYAGTINQEGALEIKVTKLASDSTLSKIMHMVEEAQADKAPIQQFVDVFAKYYTPLVIVSAIALTIIPPLLFNQPFNAWFYRALVLLVISCPCALIISTPVSIVSAIGNASKHGVLIKGGAYLEQMGNVKAIAFDKTGTLTLGKPVVTNIETVRNSANQLTEQDLLILAASVEQMSEHPLAQAIVAKAEGLPLKAITKFKALIGRGAQASIKDITIYVGNRRLFEELGQEMAPYAADIAALEQQGKTVMLVGTEDEVYGMLAVADTLRENSRNAIQALRKSGIKSISMLTGDNDCVAKSIAEKVGIDTFYSELLPEDKVSTLKTIARQYGSVVMVGDGVNDAPALATATIGVAMGVAGSDTALETADIALMSDDLSKLVYVMKLSRKTVTIIKQNISFSLLVKLLFVLGTFAGIVNLWLAVFADMGASLLVTINGMRLVKELK